jgi:cytochrome b subunit of formate dehydrogenase
MLPRVQDVRDFITNARYLTGLRPTPPKFDRFGYIEKAEYWALIWGTVVMTVTGFMLWFENQSLQIFDKWVLDLATIVHFYEAWLAFLAIVVWHFYFVIFNPEIYPMNWTWLTGRMSEKVMEHEHPRELERIKAAEKAAEEARMAEAADQQQPANTDEKEESSDGE